MPVTLIQEIQSIVRSKNYRFTLHAVGRMTERAITVNEVENAFLGRKSRVIETYEDDPRGPSCLILGFTDADRPLHVQCSYPPNIAVITAYEPKSDEWIDWWMRLKGGKSF